MYLLGPADEQALNAIRAFFTEHHYYPTYRDLAVAIGRDVKTTFQVVATLREVGYVVERTETDGKCIAICLTEPLFVGVYTVPLPRLLEGIREFPGLKQRQRQALVVIADYWHTRGYAPSMRELGAALKLHSTSSVHNVIQRLVAAGHLRQDPKRQRTISFTDRFLAQLS